MTPASQVHIDATADEDGQECRAAVMDITDRKRAEEEHRILTAKIQEAQKLENMGVLAGGIAHDLNNLLTTVMGNSQLVLRGLSPDSPEYARITRVLAAAEHAAELVEQMLAYSGKSQLVLQPVGLSELVQGTSRLLNTTITRRCSLDYILGEGLPVVDADPHQIRRMTVALILNASEAIGDRQGNISISTDVQECNQAYLNQCTLGKDRLPGLYVYLEVKDSGCGMTPEVQARLFEPFFSTKAFGRGLGLPSLLGIVRSHHGAIHVASEPDAGSTFRIYFPAAKEVARTDPVREPTMKPPLAGEAARILIVDDEDGVLEVTQDMLELAGFTVLAAAGGREAVELFRKQGNEIDAVLLDLTMPDMDGYETLHELRKMRKNLPVLICSGYSLENAQERFGSEEMPGFLTKPFQLDELIGAVRRMIDGPRKLPADG